MSRPLTVSALPMSVVAAGRSVPIAMALASLAVILLFWRDAMATAVMWRSSSSYGYCPLVPLISLALLNAGRAGWRLDGLLLSWPGGALFLFWLALWSVGQAASVNEIRQFALVGMVQASLLCLFGWRLIRQILFPLLYLFLMVPTATVLLAPLQSLTAALAGQLLRLSFIPVLIGRHLIEVPHGLYEVAPGCAGLNFLLSGLALSLVYGHVLYRGLAKRTACVVIALALAIGTNALRVFGIIWLAEATDRRIDIVNDHLVYGWVVYFFAMTAAMLAGLRFRDSAPPVTVAFVPPAVILWPRRIIALLALLLVAGAVQAAMISATRPPLGIDEVQLILPDHLGLWRKVAPQGEFPLPIAETADGISRIAYVKSGQRVEVAIAYYWRQRAGHKLDDPPGLLGTAEVMIEGKLRHLAASRLEPGGHQDLLWSFDWVGGHRATTAWAARLWGAVAAFGGDGRSASVLLSVRDDDGAAEALLRDFCRQSEPLDAALASGTLMTK